MTFSDWYNSTVKPQLEEGLKNVPAAAREPMRTASRQAMAACWNAALDAVHSECEMWPDEARGVHFNMCEIGEVYLTEVLRA